MTDQHTQAGERARVIRTSSGHEILVDEEDYEYLATKFWFVSRGGYAMANETTNGVRKKVSMHRLVAGLPIDDNRMVDHKNGNKLDNRRCNLRAASRAENCRNAKLPSTNTSGFKGACFDKRRGNWRVQIAHNGKKRKQIGVFPTAELAHEFYCLAADLIYGEFANHG